MFASKECLLKSNHSSMLYTDDVHNTLKSTLIQKPYKKINLSLLTFISSLERQKQENIRFYPDLNWGRWIQSPKC